MLTRKQRELLLLIRDRLAEDGVPPSFDEMKSALGLKSKSGIHRLITALEERGFIKRLPHRARALEIVKLPDGEDMQGKTGGAALRAANDTDLVTLPLYGKIAAGTPIEALRDPSRHLDIPPSMLPTHGTGEVYALEISGDSMIDAGIMDGDKVLIRAADTAENGAIVVALVDEEEATLKYIQKKGSQIDLVPANARYETRSFSSDRVRVQGRLVGLLRKY